MQIHTPVYANSAFKTVRLVSGLIHFRVIHASKDIISINFNVQLTALRIISQTKF